MAKRNRTEPKQALTSALLDLLYKKSFQKISVNELCQMAHVSRTTFYAHFEDKYRLLAHCLKEIQQHLDSLTATYSPEKFFIALLDAFQENERFFYHIFDSELNEEVTDMFYEFFSRNLTQCLERKKEEGYQLPGPLDAVVAFYVSGLTGMVVRWIKSNYQLPKEELAACQCNLLRDVLE